MRRLSSHNVASSLRKCSLLLPSHPSPHVSSAPPSTWGWAMVMIVNVRIYFSYIIRRSASPAATQDCCLFHQIRLWSFRGGMVVEISPLFPLCFILSLYAAASTLGRQMGCDKGWKAGSTLRRKQHMVPRPTHIHKKNQSIWQIISLSAMNSAVIKIGYVGFVIKHRSTRKAAASFCAHLRLQSID